MLHLNHFPKNSYDQEKHPMRIANVWCVAVLLLFVSFSYLSAGELFVAPGGNDTNPGTRTQPFASLQKARDVIRAAKVDGKNTERWTVRIASGTYELTAPIIFEPEDSGTAEYPVRYAGVAGRTVFSGGKHITGWTEIEDGAWKGAWAADIPKTDGTQDYFEQLFVGDRRAVRSRYPNEGFLNPAKIEQDVPITENVRKPPTTGQRLIAKEGELSKLFNVPESELKYAQLIVHHNWDTTRRIPLRFEVRPGDDGTLEVIHTQGAPMKFWNPWRDTSLYYLENFRTAFDVPGEWFYDGNAGKVYYRPLPGENPNEVSVIYPRGGLNQLIEFRGQPEAQKTVAHLQFVNLAFLYTDTARDPKIMQQAALPESVTGPLDKPGPSQFEPQQAAFYTSAVIDGNGAEGIVFENCEVSHIGEYAVRLQNSNRCRLERCAFTDLGAGAIRLGHGSSENVIDNCIIQKAGRFHASAVGVWVGDNCCDNRISHNDIGDMFYTGISVGWQWGYRGNALRNIIEYNHVHHLGQNAMSDMGGIYTLGTSHGTVVRNNIFHNIHSYAYGGWGLYTDEGSEGILMENNLVYSCKSAGFHQHYGKDNTIRNNIFALIQNAAVEISRVEDHLSYTFVNNIIYQEDGDLVADVWEGDNGTKIRAIFDQNCYWKTGDASPTFYGLSFEGWKALGRDENSIIADPLFVDVEQRDFRLKPGSPAEKIDFVPFDFSKAGVYGDAAWIERAKSGARAK
jgi:hypothetical protein